MFLIQPCSIPDRALLRRYLYDGAYADCYTTDVPGAVSHAQYVTAFYTTPVFKLERLILKWAVSRPSTDAEAEQLAAGTLDSFAAWHVEKRSENQLLLSDFLGRTKSWLMVEPMNTHSGIRTRLYFGSAVVPVKDPSYRALLGFHRIYSKVLLYAAKSRLTS